MELADEDLDDFETDDDDAAQEHATGPPAPFLPSIPWRPSLRAVFAEDGWQGPSQLQHEVVPHMVSGNSVICIGRAGLGKSNAYVLAALQRLQPLGHWSADKHAQWPAVVQAAVITFLLCSKRPNSPVSKLPHALLLLVLEQLYALAYPRACGRVRTLVLVDDKYLVRQITSEFQLRSRCMEGVRIAGIEDGGYVGSSRRDALLSAVELAQADSQRIERLEAVDPHVVVTTPIVLMRLLAVGRLEFDALDLLVLDEAEALTRPDNAACVDGFVAAAARPMPQLIIIAHRLSDSEWDRCAELCGTVQPDTPFGVWSEERLPAFFSERRLVTILHHEDSSR